MTRAWKITLIVTGFVVLLCGGLTYFAIEGSRISGIRSVLPNTAKNCAVAALTYALDNDSYLPPNDQFPEVFDHHPPPRWRDNYCRLHGTEFVLNPALDGVKLSDLNKPGEVILLYESGSLVDGKITFANCDASINRVSSQEFQSLFLGQDVELKEVAAK